MEFYFHSHTIGKYIFESNFMIIEALNPKVPIGEQIH